MSYALRTVDLAMRFRRVSVLDGLNLEVPEGSVFGFVGPNGAGKTTTIKILMNILKASGGRAEILGTPSVRLGPRDLERIGYVSENQEMPDWMTVGGFLSYLKPFYPTWDEARASDLVRQFNLPLDRKLRHLSRGMRMKASLVSSLAYHPRLLVLDEPFSGLDPLVRDELIGGILEGASGATIFISSHDLAEIESFASHIGYLDGGRIQFSEEMGSLSGRFREIEVTLGPAAQISPVWPSTWLGAEKSPALVRFVDSQFDPERSPAEIHRLFGDVHQISVKPMPLRAIFVTLARTGAKAA